MDIKIPVVIHTDFGGFALTRLMYERLRERQVSWLGRCRTSSDGRWYLPYDEHDELRRDEHLVDVVRQLESELELATADVSDWTERRLLERRMLHGLKVVNARIIVKIEDHDGKEIVRVAGGAW